MKTLKLNLVLLVTVFAVLFSGCEEEEFVAPVPEEEIDDFKSPGEEKPKVVVKAGIPADEYQSYFNKMAQRGLRLIFIDGFLHNDGVANDTKATNYFNVIFEENTDGIKWASFHGLSGSDYQNKFNQYTSNDYKLIHIESYPQNGGIRYAPIFAKVSGPSYTAYHGIKIKNHQDKFEDLVAKGYRLVNRSIVKVGEQNYVTALYDKKNVGSWVSKSGLDENETQTMMENQSDQGRMLGFLDISQTSPSKFTYGPIFNSEKHDGWYALNKLTMEELEDEIADAASKGYRTNLVVGYDEPGLINGNEVYNMRFAASWIK